MQKRTPVAGVNTISWREGTATNLPFENDTFDVTLSCVVHIFAAPPDNAAKELLRVTRSGGLIGFTSWTPTNVVPAMGRVLTEYLSPDPDPPEPPFLWTDPDVVENRLGNDVKELAFDTGTVLTPALSPAHYWEAAITQAGMFIVALNTIPEAVHPALREDMIETIVPYFDESQNAVRMEYLLTQAVVD